MKKVALCIVIVLSGQTAAATDSGGTICERFLKLSLKGWAFSQYTIPLLFSPISALSYNHLTLLRDETWASAYPSQGPSDKVVFNDIENAYPDSKVALLKFPAQLYTSQGTRIRFEAGTIVILDRGLVSRSIQRPNEEEIEKSYIRFVRMHHHHLSGSTEYFEDDGRSWPIDKALLKFVTERYTRLTGREFPTAQVHMSVVHGTRDPIVLKLLRKYTQLERSDFAP